MNSSDFFISMNDNMKEMLNRYRINYKNLVQSKLPPNLFKYIKKGIVYLNELDCYSFKHNLNFQPVYDDSSWDENFNNKIWVDKRPDPAKSLRICLNFIFRLAQMLKQYPKKFKIVMSIHDDDNESVITFYCVRPSEPIEEDLDSYLEAIFVLTTKADECNKYRL